MANPWSRQMSREMSGAEMVIEALADQGVEHLFGYPGGAVLPIYDALFQQDKVRHILVRHEQGAVHAAEGYARSTGKVGCVLVTSGPGATNAVTGLTDALMDSIPLVVHHRAGADPSHRQRCVPGMRHRRHHPALHQAQLSGEERRRPAARAARGVPYRQERPAGAGGRRHPEGHPVRQGRSIPGRRNSSTRATGRSSRATSTRIKAAIELMRHAKRPLFYTGGGVINSGPRGEPFPARAGQAHRLSHHLDADGARRLSRRRSAMARHARHARHLRGQPVDARLRPDDLHRRALRRPHHRPARCLLARLEEDPRRHRPVLDQQERQGRRPDHRRLRARARGHGAAVARRRDARRTRRRSTPGGSRSTTGARANRSPTRTRTRSSSRNTPSSGSTS